MTFVYHQFCQKIGIDFKYKFKLFNFHGFSISNVFRVLEYIHAFKNAFQITTNYNLKRSKFHINCTNFIFVFFQT